MRSCFDQAMAHHWEQARTKGLQRHNFVEANFASLGLLMDRTDVRMTIDALKANTDLDPMAISRLSKSSTTGCKLFDDCAVKMDFKNFLENIDKRLNDLDHLDFNCQDVNDFKRLMSRTTSAMKHHGQKYFDKKAAKLTFLGSSIELPLGCLDDEWSFRLAARVKSAAVNAGLVRRLPWEVFLLEKDKIKGVRETCPVPKELLKDIDNCREACLGFLGTGSMSISDMKRVCNHHSKALVSLDRTFILDIQFVNDEAETLIAAGVREEVLEALPCQDEDVKVQAALIKLESIKALRRTLACGPKLESEVTGIIGMAHAISQGLCPTRNLGENLSAFYLACLKRMENFCIHTTVATTAKGKEVRLQRGHLGLQAHFKEMKEAYRVNGLAGKTLNDVSMFRTFKWMLGREEQVETDSWITSILRQHVGPQPTKELTNGDPTEAKESNTALACVLLGQTTSSSSSSSTAPPPSLKSSLAGKAGSTKATKEAAMITTRENMMKFFAAKPKS
jgi:hypothetical protein